MIQEVKKDVKKISSLSFKMIKNIVLLLLKNRDLILKPHKDYNLFKYKINYNVYSHARTFFGIWVILIKEQALQFSVLLVQHDFQARSGWTEKFKKTL